MMQIDITINGRRIGAARAVQYAELAGVSDYRCKFSACTENGLLTGWSDEFVVCDHLRSDGPWELARRIAEHVAAQKEPPP